MRYRTNDYRLQHWKIFYHDLLQVTSDDSGNRNINKLTQSKTMLFEPQWVIHDEHIRRNE